MKVQALKGADHCNDAIHSFPSGTRRISWLSVRPPTSLCKHFDTRRSRSFSSATEVLTTRNSGSGSIMHILHIVGARPNFMKAAPVLDALEQRGVKQTLVHTGQHYDVNMSDIFFTELGMRHPDVNLEVGSGTHARQTAEIMTRLEPILVDRKPDMVLVYGDVNSTSGAALVCSKLPIPVGHVEAGLRSFDRSMPEEINRVITDQLSDFLFTPSEDGNDNLRREGIRDEKIYLVGNVMIDSLVRLLPSAEGKHVYTSGQPYALVTLHRPSNVDDPEVLRKILECLLQISGNLRTVFPVHPRTRKKIAELGIDLTRLDLLGPLAYIEFLALQRNATVVLTDSGGIQEETTYLGIPCITLRDNTERPITTTMGTNIVVGRDMNRLTAEVSKILAGRKKVGAIPPLWDGRAGERIAEILVKALEGPPRSIDPFAESQP